MQTVEEFIYTRLRDDAEIRTATGGASPHYNVFHFTPKFSFDFSTMSMLVYTEIAGNPTKEAKPILVKDEFYDITAYGSNFETILDRVFELLHG